ncbi:MULTISPECIES: hypothetical protein [Trichocoleus]|uniref:Uncharacterized protein n=1 Tax=Trichocoleus desertorum GB2-A4 TaxID=2933944 RepID=A0ABV0J773_9CYAN|nr:hypothetical protein [Trichocoleus sp. FACHB-46]MBD1862591.1 hypothetical protein [Trichocoleus sp. FACHB-46]
MLHLAQVQKKGFLGKAELQLLARQKSETTWVLAAKEDVVLSAEAHAFGEGTLVLVEVSEDRQVANVQDATEWVLELVQKYLIAGLTPALLQQEAERAEQWRQSLTLQSQELGRRTLEVEARREQIQELEENLKREKQELEALAQQLKVSLQNES